MKSTKVILVTGASSGIGQAVATLFSKLNYTVYGTTRKNVEPNKSSSGDICMIKMDITDDDSVHKGIKYIINKEKTIDILVNCAGFGISGAIEATPVNIAKEQFDVNFFGTIRVIQKVLPYMRAKKNGYIINIGSVAGFVPIPFQSMYSASKSALESLSKALKMELEPFNIKVCLIQPGDTCTNFPKSRIKAGVKEIEDKYKPISEFAVKKMEEDEKAGYSPYKVAYVIKKIVHKKRVPTLLSVGFIYKFIYFISLILPTFIKEYIVKNMYIKK